MAAGMREPTFLELIEQAAAVTPGQARVAARATLCTLAERIGRGEALDLAPFIPGEFRDLLLSAPEHPEWLGVAQFVHRVAERQGVPGTTALRHVRAVLAAIVQFASLDALSNLAEVLGNDFEPMLDVARNRRDPTLVRDPRGVGAGQAEAVDGPKMRRT